MDRHVTSEEGHKVDILPVVHIPPQKDTSGASKKNILHFVKLYQNFSPDFTVEYINTKDCL